jgi:hypothetical protein
MTPLSRRTFLGTSLATGARGSRRPPDREHLGLGHGLRAHAPDEYFLIESQNPKVTGLDGAIRSYVDYLYALA